MESSVSAGRRAKDKRIGRKRRPWRTTWEETSNAHRSPAPKSCYRSIHMLDRVWGVSSYCSCHFSPVDAVEGIRCV